MNPFSLFDRRYRGFRVIEIGGLGVLLALALVVYLAKTHAGGERADIDHIQAQIDGEQARVMLLRAEVAKLEQPERLESLSGRYLNLQPVAPTHEISAEALAQVARPAPPAPAAKAPPSVAATAADSAVDATLPPAAAAASDTDPPQ